MRLALFHPSDRALKALFFAAAVAIGLALLATSPTFAQEPTVGIQTSTSPPTPYLVKDIWSGDGIPDVSFPSDFAEVGGIVYFEGRTLTHWNELWRSDGTPEGTYMVTDLRPGTSGSLGRPLVVMDDNLYFYGNDGSSGADLASLLTIDQPRYIHA